ncbi:hypothetical protein PBY51_005322 [Eleginops maclovinus]|uniref:Uncharacterized protein n=1 Tax=Eleginops maclovinus TaxID=56733 RepID=A0AAN8AGJ8_ELEMC|nr:hypothetical protein PBY51_005322 [Eleginops maclovinus]
MLRFLCCCFSSGDTANERQPLCTLDHLTWMKLDQPGRAGQHTVMHRP